MDDYVLLLIRWFHTIAAVVWIGGGIFYWTILTPVLHLSNSPPSLSSKVSYEFNRLVKLAIWVLVITGAILLTTRLTEEVASPEYVVILAVKIALAFLMFFLVFSMRKKNHLTNLTKSTAPAVITHKFIPKPLLVTGLGIIVFFLSVVLQLIVEKGLFN